MPQLERELPALEQAPSGSPPPTGPAAMVIFGGTGDLTARKLFPALYNLVKSKLLSSDFAIIGVGRNDYTNEQYRQIMSENLQKFATGTVAPKPRDWLCERVCCVSGDLKDPGRYTRLAQPRAEMDKTQNKKSTYL